MPKFAVVLPAAGQSSRFRDKEKKPFVNLDGRAVWLRCAELFVTRDDVVQTIIVVDPSDQEMFRRRYGANMAFMNVQIADGGKTRSESVSHAIDLLKPEVEFIAVHDAARPCVTEELIDAVFAKAEKNGAAILANPVADTLKRSEDSQRIRETVPRKGLWAAQTPQVFRKDILVEAYNRADKSSPEITDDAQLVESMGIPVSIVEGSSTNIKITTKADLYLAEAILKSRPSKPKAGPIHPFAEEQMWGGWGKKT